MAGAGSRFEKAGYTFPKPLIEVDGKPMIQAVVENIDLVGEARHIFIVQEEHYDRYALKYLLPLIAGEDTEIVKVNGLTEGAACTTLLAKALINNDEPLLLANSDQIIRWKKGQAPFDHLFDQTEGLIYTFQATHPKWSFARTTAHNQVLEVAEKRPISHTATCGVYRWRRGRDYVKYAEQMIEKQIRTNGEFYVCPVYNEAIEDGMRVTAVDVDGMWGIGTPEDLETYLVTLRS